MQSRPLFEEIQYQLVIPLPLTLPLLSLPVPLSLSLPLVVSLSPFSLSLTHRLFMLSCYMYLSSFSPQQEEWDKNIPEVKLTRVLALNAKEWWIILLGLLGSVITGSIFPLFAVIFGNILDVFTLPPEEIFDEIHFWAAMFIVLGFVSGVAVFLKVCPFFVCICKSLCSPIKVVVILGHYFLIDSALLCANMVYCSIPP